MVLGLRSKNRKGTSVQVYYLIQIQEIKPWPPSQSLKSIESVLLQWENGDQNSGSFTSVVGNGKAEFSESFRLPVTFYREVSRKGAASDSFQKNYLEFSLYEPRKAMKGQLLGSALVNLAYYGIIKDAITISVPINLKKSSKSAAQSVLYINIQPFEGDNSLSKEVSLDGSESVSEVTNEGNDEETEIASFTDDDVDDNISSHSSQTVSSLAVESSSGSPGQDEKNLLGSANVDISRNIGKPSLPSGMPPSKPGVNCMAEASEHLDGSSSHQSTASSLSSLQNPAKYLVDKVVLSNNYIQVNKNSNHEGLEIYKTMQEADKKYLKDGENGLKVDATSNLHVNLVEDKQKMKQQDNRQVEELMVEKKHILEEEELVDKLPQESMRRQMKLRSNTLASNKVSNGVQGNTRRDRLKHLKSVQLQFNVAQTDETLSNTQVKEKKRQNENLEKVDTNYIPSEERNTTNQHLKNKIQLKSEVETAEKWLNEAAAEDVGLYSITVKHGNSTNKLHQMKKEKEDGCSGENHKVGVNCGPSESDQTENSSCGNKVELESKVEMLEEELMEAAVLEAGLYSVIAEHGSSTNKVHAPARRLSRFYIHSCKASSRTKRANAARAIISGLVLVSKACGNDVPRLTFWLSNSILLRAIVSQLVEQLQLAAALSTDNNGIHMGKYKTSREAKDTNKTGCSDEWEDPQTFIEALERVEAWIFLRIVESVWWQTLTPHMQSSAVKGSKKTHTARKYGLGDQEQGLFAIDLWKKAFKDACERLCPIRAGGLECGCLPMLARLVMEQLVQRLDVAMFNAILRESAEEMPTDPVSDPISDPKVLPIPAGKSSFGAGAQLKNAVGNWSRWLTDLFGIDDSDCLEDKDGSNQQEQETSFKAFNLLRALSDLMMLPFDMLADSSIRKEVCPIFGARIIERVLFNFVPDEFNPDPIPDAVFESLESEDTAGDKQDSVTTFPCIASPTIYSLPSPASLTNVIGEVETQTLQRCGSAMLRKSYTSDDELDELDSPMTYISNDSSRTSSVPTLSNWVPKSNGGRKVVRYQLLRQVWKDGE